MQLPRGRTYPEHKEAKKHLQIGCWPRKGQPRDCKKRAATGLYKSPIFSRYSRLSVNQKSSNKHSQAMGTKITEIILHLSGLGAGSLRVYSIWNRALESSLLDKPSCPGLRISVTLSNSRKTTPGYCVNTKIGTFLGGERKTN